MTPMTATALAAALSRRELSAEQVLRDCLERIDQREPELHAFAHLDPAPALARARQLDAGAVTGPLHGLPLGVKDLFDTADLPTAYGSAIWHCHQPRADAGVVAACRAAGALIPGKTVTTEFAAFTAGPTRNPHHAGRLVQRLGRGGGGRMAAAGAGHADRCLHRAAGGVLRHRRLQAQRRPHRPRRRQADE